MADRADILPRSLEPIGVSREVAAASIGVSPTLFDQMIRDRRMPSPKVINSRKVWDVEEVRRAFKALPSDGDGDPPDGDANPWDAGGEG